MCIRDRYTPPPKKKDPANPVVPPPATNPPAAAAPAPAVPAPAAVIDKERQEAVTGLAKDISLQSELRAQRRIHGDAPVEAAEKLAKLYLERAGQKPFNPVKEDEVKKFLDFMAYYKFKHFHWHLTEDQGWRIEIKKYPKLQDVAAYRNETLIGHYNDTPHKFDGKRYGGYYTQKEIKDLVSFAEGRNIHVIPEIEMPGHALAALAAYPELGCSGGPYKVATKWGVFEEVFCPTENTFAFLYDVLDEVISLFPYKYIHIGGDECPKSSWQKSSVCQKIIKENGLKDEYELQSYFIKKIENYRTSKGRQIIGWDEILEGGLAPGATVMSWRGTEGGIEAARLGHDVIMTPGSFCYFDHYQSTNDKEPLAIGGYTSLEKVYHWKPIPETLEPPYKKHILGGQANVWTEYIQDFRQVEYMAYARGLAMSEALWTTPGDYKEFTGRFLKHNDYWKTKGVNIANHVFELKPKIMAGKGKPVKISFDLPMEKQVWHEWSGNSKLGNEFDLIDKGLHHFSLDATSGTSRSVSVTVSYTHLRAHETVLDLVCRLLLEKKTDII